MGFFFLSLQEDYLVSPAFKTLAVTFKPHTQWQSPGWASPSLTHPHTQTHSTPHIYPVRYLSNFGPINSVCICRSGSSMLRADRWAWALGG